MLGGSIPSVHSKNMSEMTKTIRNASLWVTTFILVGSLIAFGVFSQGSRIESKAFPMFKDVTLTYIVKQQDSADVLLTGIKARDCLLHAANIQVYKDGVWRNASGTILDEANKPITYENQRVAVNSPFVRRVRVEPSGSVIKIKLESKCHPFWTSYQELPEVTVQPGQDNSGVAQR